MYIPEDRRKSTMPVERERRIDERLSVLEVKVDGHQEKLEENQDLLNRFLEKFDGHIIEEIQNTKSIEQTMLKVTNTVDNLTSEISRTNTSLELLAKDIVPTVKTVTKWSTAIDVLAKGFSIGVLILGAIWTVYTFVIEHKESIPLVQNVSKSTR